MPGYSTEESYVISERNIKTMTGAELKKLAFDKIDTLAEKIIAIGDTVWKNPEPGYREYKTARLAAETFRSLGLTTREGG